MNEHDRQWLDSVRPGKWRNPLPAPRYHLVVLGGGTAGLVAAAGAAAVGARVALVEKHRLGGDCLNAGCVPSKALIRAARAAHAVRTAREFGVGAPEVLSVDFARVMKRMRQVRAELSPHDSAQRFRDLGVDIFFGEGRFAASDKVLVEGQVLRFARAVIATGARAAIPAVPGLKDVPFLTNETLFSLAGLPRRFAVLGAGPIGCEMAQTFARLGAEVFLIESAHGVLPKEDRDAAARVQDALVRDGVKLLCCGRDLRVGRAAHGLVLDLESHGRTVHLEVDHLLVATGRAPDLEGLNLETAGIEYDRNGVRVNDFLQTTNPRVYACGDVCSRHRFTHAADSMARLVVRNALFPGRSRVSSLLIPHCTYTSPELAHVGLTPAEARERGIPVETFTVPFSQVDRAVLDGETEGFTRVHVFRGTDRIAGATVVAPHAGELISELTLAMRQGIRLRALARVIHPYPSCAESIRKLGDLYLATRLTPFVRALLRAWFRWL